MLCSSYTIRYDVPRAEVNNYCHIRIPFYSWIRLGFLLYLILPQTQGARVLYQSHVHPFLRENELAIDDFISSAHDRAKAAGLSYLKHAIELFKQHVLGFPPKAPTPPPTPGPFSYTQSLMARFNLPSARASMPANPVIGATNTANDFYTLLASAVSAATSRDPFAADSGETRDISNSQTLIPPSVQGEERLSFIASQRERLSILLSALDKEANTLQTGEGASDYSRRSGSGLSSRKSEGDFEKIDAESEAEDGASHSRRQTSGGSWMPWDWGVKPETNPDPNSGVAAGLQRDEGKARSSGVDTHYY